MARTNSINFTGPLQYPIADAATDLFKKEDVQVATKALDLHDHSNGKGLPLAAGAIPNGVITSAMIADGTISTGDLADGAVTAAKIADGTITAADIADKGITNAKLGPDVPRLNLVTNASFEIWQRGAGPFTSTGIYCADGWVIWSNGTGTVSVTKDTAVTNGSATSLKMVVAGSSGAQRASVSDYTCRENIGWMRGKTFTISCDVRCDTAGGVSLNVWNDVNGGAPGATHPGGNQWIRLTATAVVPSNANDCHPELRFETNCTANLDNCTIALGSVGSDYVPLHTADELQRALRYYQVLTRGPVQNMVSGGFAWSPNGGTFSYPYLQPLNAVPTITFSAPATWGMQGSANNALPGNVCNSISAGGQTNSQVSIIASTAASTSTAVGHTTILNSFTGQTATITVESAP